MRAMVIDDSKAMRSILKRLLNECGFSEVLEAGTGREGLDAMNGGTLDLALVDSTLSEMSGREFVAAVRANPEWDDISVMLIASETATGAVEDALAVGADACVAKPFTKAVLFEKVETIKSARA